MSRLAASRKNPKAYAGNRYLLADIKAKLDSGLIESSTYYDWGKVWTPTNGPFEDPYKKAKHIRLPEDRLRYLFACAFPKEATKAHRLLPGESHWFEHPSDRWVSKQMALMSEKNLTEEESWQEMLVQHRKDVQQAELETRYQLQQVQIEGGLPISKPPLETQLVTRRYTDAVSRRVTHQYEACRTKILQDATQRIKEAERTRKPVRKIMADDYPHNFPFDIVPQLVKDHPGLEAAFDDAWYIGSAPLERMMPMSPEQKKAYEEFCEMLEKQHADTEHIATRNHLAVAKEQLDVVRVPYYPIEATLLAEEVDENLERNSDSVEDTVGGRIERIQTIVRESLGTDGGDHAKVYTVAHLEERDKARTALQELERELEILGGTADAPDDAPDADV